MVLVVSIIATFQIIKSDSKLLHAVYVNTDSFSFAFKNNFIDPGLASTIFQFSRLFRYNVFMFLPYFNKKLSKLVKYLYIVY